MSEEKIIINRACPADTTCIDATIYSELSRVAKYLVENRQDMPPEFNELVDRHFWELLR